MIYKDDIIFDMEEVYKNNDVINNSNDKMTLLLKVDKQPKIIMDWFKYSHMKIDPWIIAHANTRKYIPILTMKQIREWRGDN